MHTCGYCGTEVQVKVNMAYCSFCEMDLWEEDITEDGQRRELVVQKAVLLIDAKRPTPYLMEQSAFSLIKLLKLVRAERKRLYEMSRLFRKGNEVGGGFTEQQQVVNEDYELFCRKAWAIENILRDKMGVFPARITDDMLEKMLEQMHKQGYDIMNFRAPRSYTDSLKK
ncbi:hypothetical protein [Paenibacillus shenyangensis]|uniref:hypothetical protein n=1 Tax=Paenibacillus sp. A9 TaxID=1284352 RepID=UPI00035C5E57|nr:hypothetical protein [Paenibacillus sp. A9]